MPDQTYILDAVDRPVTVTRCTEFVVVSFWQPDSSSSNGSYHYEPFTDRRDADAVLAEYMHGEYPKARAIGMFAARHGMPIGGRLA
jgi:hypothetical protein